MRVRRKRGGAGLALVVASLVSVALASTLGAAPVAARGPVPAPIAPTADWLTVVNYYRAMAGQAPVREDPSLSTGAGAHACYMLHNGITHDEVPGRIGYTAQGDIAGNSGNVATSSVFGTSARSHIELWMTGPFHAIGVLRSNLGSVGFGKCDAEETPQWHSAATLDVLRGLTSAPRPRTPILFPGNGTTTVLSRFIAESPNPVTFCGWTGAAGLPVIAMMPEGISNPSATMSGPTGQLEVCVLTAANTTGVASDILRADNAMVIVPRSPLAAGGYSVDARTSARSVKWSFTVDPNALGSAAAPPVKKPPPSPAAPVGTAAPIGDPSALVPISPVRLVDTRTGLGTTRLPAGSDVRIQVTGAAGIPVGTNAIAANVTVTSPSAAGFLTLWNCSGGRPLVSTLNFLRDEIVPNSATIPLDAKGAICAHASAATDLVLDVTGFYSSGGSGRYTQQAPRRLMDTRAPIGPSSRLSAGQTVELQVAGQAGVPAGSTAAALNVTSVGAGGNGFVTIYPCAARPPTSSVNPSPGRTRANLVVAPLSARGSVCIYSSVSTDLIVDVTGSLAPSATTGFTPSSPFRFTDTRDRSRTELHAGSNGTALAAGRTLQIQMAGVRGVPLGASGVSANLTVVDAASSGFLVAWPCGEVPPTSTLNYDARQPIANAAVLPLSSSGATCLRVSSTAQVIIDVNGWWK